MKFDHDHVFPFLFQEIGVLKGFASSEEKRKSVGDREKMIALQAGKLSFDRMEKEFFCGVGKENVFEQRSLTVMKRSDVWRIWENDADLMGKQTCERVRSYVCEWLTWLELGRFVFALQQVVNTPWKGKNYCQSDLQD